MAQPISTASFQSQVDEWRALYTGACTLYRTGSFARSIELVNAIAALGAAQLDIRDNSVLVRLAAPGRQLTDEHVLLALAISSAARQLGMTADPSAVQDLQISFDASTPAEVSAFWSAALGYDADDDHLHHPLGLGPSVFIDEKTYVAPRNRIHIDLSLPHDEAERRIAAVLAAGGRVLGDRYAPAWVSLIDSEGNVIDIATWMGRETDG